MQLQQHPAHGGPMFFTEQALRSYLKNLPIYVLHFLEIQSPNNKLADIFFHFDEERMLVTVAPYFKRRRGERVVIENSVAEPRPETLLALGAPSLTNLSVRKFVQIGGPIVTNYQKDEKKIERIKYLYAVTESEGNIKQKEDELIPGPNGLPLWIHVDLLPLIFLNKRIVDGREKQHQQRLAYLQAKQWIDSKISNDEPKIQEIEKW